MCDWLWHTWHEYYFNTSLWWKAVCSPQRAAARCLFIFSILILGIHRLCFTGWNACCSKHSKHLQIYYNYVHFEVNAKLSSEGQCTEKSLTPHKFYRKLAQREKSVNCYQVKKSLDLRFLMVILFSNIYFKYKWKKAALYLCLNYKVLTDGWHGTGRSTDWCEQRESDWNKGVELITAFEMLHSKHSFSTTECADTRWLAVRNVSTLKCIRGSVPRLSFCSYVGFDSWAVGQLWK